MHEHGHLAGEFGFHTKKTGKNLLYNIYTWLEVFAISYLECNIWFSDLLALIFLCENVVEVEIPQPLSNLGKYS